MLLAEIEGEVQLALEPSVVVMSLSAPVGNFAAPTTPLCGSTTRATSDASPA
ncbi:MAG TPA: hypothetical protein VHZ56_10470 [Devosia sp.]|nr:hypothetical protein [Devosia sp.]